MNLEQMKELVAKCEFQDYVFTVRKAHAGIVLQGEYYENSISTGKPELQVTRKWILTPSMVKSEIVQTVFKCVMTSMEHRAREHFKYRGKRVFGPHFDVDALWEICRERKFDVRDDNPVDRTE